MLELVSESDIYKRVYVKKNKVKGTVPNNFKWLVNRTKAEKGTKNIAGSA